MLLKVMYKTEKYYERPFLVQFWPHLFLFFFFFSDLCTFYDTSGCHRNKDFWGITPCHSYVATGVSENRNASIF
jgi:hypothetical protein